MALIDWRQEFETGIAEVDHEHVALVALINRIHADLLAGAGTTAADCLGELHDAIAAHFALEEKLMRARAYARYAPHKEDHERLLDEIRDLMEAHGQVGAAATSADLSVRLERWFSRHFQTLDAQLHRQIGEL
jgi:hemerythrin